MAKKDNAKGKGARQSKDKLGLNASWSMAVGGMIGGGIFSTLGVVIALAGAWAWASFLVGGLIALATAHSYAELTRHHQGAGGVFIYLHDRNHERAARISVWTLLLGYTLTVAVYAYTFGAYLADAVGGPDWIKPAAALVSIAALAGINLLGVKESAGVEVFVVWAKLAILLALAAIGVAHWAPDKLATTAGAAAHSSPILGTVVGAASVFMAYEGFQLLAYDYDDMEDADAIIGKGMLGAVAVCIIAYVLVALGAAMLVGADAIIENKEVSLAMAGRAAAGEFGFIAVTVAAVFSTASAINATIFSTARLCRRAAERNEMPKIFDRENARGVPWFGIVLIAAVAAVMALFGGLDPLVNAASFVFLTVFAVVNILAVRREAGTRWVSIVGAAGAVVAAAVLALHLAKVV